MRKFWKKETEWYWSCVCLDLSCRHFAAIEESVEICCRCNPRFSSLPPTKSHHKSCTRRDRPAAKPAGSSLAANSVLDNRLVPPGPVAGTSHAFASKAMMLFSFALGRLCSQANSHDSSLIHVSLHCTSVCYIEDSQFLTLSLSCDWPAELPMRHWRLSMC
jgi:hypothetical protein